MDGEVLEDDAEAMMVIITNMQMPRACCECRYYYGYLCHANGITSEALTSEISKPESHRGAGCPLRELDMLQEAMAEAGEHGLQSAT